MSTLTPSNPFFLPQVSVIFSKSKFDHVNNSMASMAIHLSQNKDEVTYITTFKTLPTSLDSRCTNSSLLFSVSQTVLLSVPSCPFIIQGFCVCCSFFLESYSFPFYLVNTYSSFRSLLNHHFLKESFLDFPFLGQISLTVWCPISFDCGSYYSCNFIFIYRSLLMSNCLTRV